jgi:hypothetical protein
VSSFLKFFFKELENIIEPSLALHSAERTAIILPQKRYLGQRTDSLEFSVFL